MLNWLILLMITVSVISAALLGNMHLMTEGILQRCQAAVMTVMLPGAGLITLWMGVMHLVEKSGLIWHVSRLFRPILRRIYPDIPADHPVMGSIALNLGATMLGAGNAATPLGIRAMQQLNALNPHKGVASNAMCMFLAMNTSAITLVPASTLARLSGMGAKEGSSILIPTLITTIIATAAGIISCKLLQRLPMNAHGPLPEAEVPVVEQKIDEVTIGRPAPLATWKKLVLALFVLIPLGGAVWYAAAPKQVEKFQKNVSSAVTPAKKESAQGASQPAAPPAAPLSPQKAEDESTGGPGARLIQVFSTGMMPFLLAFFVLYAALSGLNVFSDLVEGAKDGMFLTLRVTPYVVAMLAAIGMLRESGAMKIIEGILGPVLGWLGFPVEVLPMAIVRPMSGSGATGVLAEIGQTYGADHMLTKIAATINGGTETTFYVAAIYFGAVGVKKIRHSVAAGLIADATAMIAAVALCRSILG